jgi:glutathione S-transferase
MGCRSASPFTLKAEALLCMAGLPYERKYGMYRSAPRGKLPVLDDSGTLIPDSDLIKSHLESHHGAQFDDHLDERQKAIGLAAQRMIEDHLYFINVYQRWNLHPDVLRETFFAPIPKLLRGFIFKKVAKGIRETVNKIGLGRHSEEQMTAYAAEDWAALATILGDKPFLLGDEPSSFDASLWGAVHGTIRCSLDTPSRMAALTHQNLIDFEKRFEARFFDQA